MPGIQLQINTLIRTFLEENNLSLNRIKMTTRQERIAFCEQCTKRSFSPQKGIICSLTDAQATFEGTCPDFERDQKAAEIVAQENEVRQNQKVYDESLGMSAFGVKNGILAGIISIVGAFVWFFGGMIFLNRIFFYPIFLVGYGIYAIVKGTQSRNERAQSTRKNKDLLDDSF
jgi:hypothetical protein